MVAVCQKSAPKRAELLGKDNIEIHLPDNFDMSSLCTWVDPRVVQSREDVRMLIRESVFLATEDDDAESLSAVFAKPGNESYFESVQESQRLRSASLEAHVDLADILCSCVVGRRCGQRSK